MKEKSVKNLLSGNKNAAPAENKKGKGKGGSSGKEDDGNSGHCDVKELLLWAWLVPLPVVWR